MKLTWHIFRKDFRNLYPTFLVWILSGICIVVMPWQAGNGIGIRVVLLALACVSFYVLFFIQVVGVVQEDCVIGSTVFWRTRPISPGRLLAAKGMFIVGLSFVPLAAVALSRLFLTDHQADGWKDCLVLLSFALFTGGLAACTKDLINCCLALVICLILFFVASELAKHWLTPIALYRLHEMVGRMAYNETSSPVRHDLGQRSVFARVPVFVVTAIIASVIGIGAMLIQYFTRRTAATVSLLCVGVLSAGVVSSYWKLGALVNSVTTATVKLDPHVQSILTAAANFYVSAQSFEVDINSVTHMATMKNRASSFHVALQRPDLFSIVIKAGLAGTMVSNGKTLITYRPWSNKYTSTDAPANFPELLSPMNLTLVEGGPLLGFEAFFQEDPIGTFEVMLRKSEYIGLEEIGGLPTQHIRLTSSSSVTDYWIADGPQPLLMQAQITLDVQMFKKGLPPGTEKMVRISTYTNWRINQPVAADTFQLQPSPEAKLVTEFFKRPPHPLVGKMAPDFQLNDLSGKPVKLSGLHGKIVVIDFWDTLNESHDSMLSMVTEAISARKMRGVVFYAVNLKQSADIIRVFQKDRNLDFPVLSDSDGAVAKLYLAKNLPQSVLIDKDGKIEAVYVGHIPRLKKDLGQQLDDMIAGKSLLSDMAPVVPANGQ